ncbi:hypothetical protein Tco_0591616 [Tanacetum coccineum]
MFHLPLLMNAGRPNCSLVYLDYWPATSILTRDRSQLTNFINKFLGTVKFGNDHVAKILGYGDYQIGNVTISRVYYVEGLGHNLFSVGKFYDSNLEVAFRQQQCFIRNIEEAVATACYTQNRSIVRLRHGKTPYELLHDKPLDLSFFYVFGALCYPTSDSENLGKRIIETIHVDFDELTAMASEHSSSGPALHEMTPATISSGLVPNPPPLTPCSSHASGSSENEGTGVSPGVPDVPTYGSEDEQISWKSSDKDDDDEVSMSKDDDDNADNEDDDDQDDDNEQTESNNDGDDFVHPKFSTHNKEVRQDEEDKEEEYSDLRVHRPSHFESTDDEAYDEVTQGDNVQEKKLDEEKTNKEEEVNEMYNDVNINLKGRDIEMKDALLVNVQATQAAFPDCSTLIQIHDYRSNSIQTLSQLSGDVLVTTNDEIPPSSVTTLPPPLIPLIQPLVKSLEDDFSEFKQTNLFAKTVSSIPGIVDKYLVNQMNEAVKAVVQLQSYRLRDEAKAENEDIINTIDANIKKIIKEQVKVQVKEQVSKILPRIKKSVNEQLEDEVLIRSSNEDKTSHAVAANLSELELKKIPIDKMENNKSIDRSVQQKTLYKALVDAYENDKDILTTYRDTDNTSKSTDSSKEGSKSITRSTNKSAQAEEQVYIVKDLEEPAHQEFKTGFTEDHPIDETTQLPDWFQKPAKPPTPNRNWNKTLPAVHGPTQPWISTLARKEDPRESLNELMDTPLDFSAFMLNRLKVDTLTLELLASPTFELMKGSCKSLVELEYFL